MKLKAEIQKIIKYNNIKLNNLTFFVKRKENKNIYNRIIKETSFLEEDVSFWERIFCVLNNIKEIQLCDNCKKNKVKFQYLSIGYSKYCWYKCSANNKKTLEKRRKTIKIKYWFENISQVEKFKEKKKNTLLNNYGVNHPSLSKIILKKKAENNKRKYWTKTWAEQEHLILETIVWYNEIIKNKNLNSEISYDFKNKEYKIKCFNCWNISKTKSRNLIIWRIKRSKKTPCLRCLPYKANESKEEDIIISFIKHIYDWNIQKRNRTILKGKEIDILLTDISLWIEINGIYWHSTIKNWNKGKNYHYEKFIKAKENAINLIQIYDDELKKWMYLIYFLIRNKWKLKDNIDYGLINNIFDLDFNIKTQNNWKILTVKNTKNKDFNTYDKFSDTNLFYKWVKLNSKKNNGYNSYYIKNSLNKTLIKDYNCWLLLNKISSKEKIYYFTINLKDFYFTVKNNSQFILKNLILKILNKEKWEINILFNNNLWLEELFIKELNKIKEIKLKKVIDSNKNKENINYFLINKKTKERIKYSLFNKIEKQEINNNFLLYDSWNTIYNIKLV